MPTIINGSDNFNTNNALNNDGTGRLNTTGITEDSAGRVTMPYQPAFNAYYVSGESNNNVIFTNTRLNIGNHFNASTGIFTAQVGGTYHFSFAILSNSTGPGYARILFKVNGMTSTTYGDTLNKFVSDWISSSMSTTVYLNQNDTIQLYNEGNNIYTSGAHGSFSGYLIG